jgi:peptide/nickel transport system substrate-binding protein
VTLNIRPVFAACRAVVRQFRAQGGGTIINLSSIAARTGGGGGSSLYAGSKAFVATFSRALAKEVAADGIRVTGVLATPMQDRTTPPEMLEAIRRQIPQRRIGSAEGARSHLPLAQFRAAERLRHRPGGGGERRAVDAMTMTVGRPMLRRRVLGAGAAGLAGLAAPRIGRAATAGLLRFVPQVDLASLDPMWTTSYVTRNHGYMVYDTLYGLDEQYRPRPQMVEGHQISKDGLGCVLTLREGLKFHDNEPLLARDAVARIQRWAKRDPFGQALLAATAELSASADKTIRFRLHRAFPLLPNALGKAPSSMPCIMLARLAKTDAMTQVTDPVGSGPFRFLPDERVQGSRFVYAKFPGYVPRQEAASFTAGGKSAQFERVEWDVIPDPATASAALRSGEVDWWEQPTADLLPMLRRAGTLGVESIDPTGVIGTVRFNTTQPPFDDPAVRRALLGAFNQENFMSAVAGTDRSSWRSGVGFFCPESPMASEGGLAALAGVDPAVTKWELAAVGYRGAKTVLLGASEFPSMNAVSRVAASMLENVGMAVDTIRRWTGAR